MAEIHVMPGVERRDLIGPEIPARQTLEEAITAGLHDVIIVGKWPDGSQYVAVSMADADRAAGIMLRAANWLTSVRIDNDAVIDTEDGA
ncbi:hypothetical protein EZH22_24470 [Xanthobacter dioxanivorans]|uniref:Uncharacterized protein n=1 Tax=Xanthobacter dioxanivorans TaxID=2528964 RepID=A0A974PMM8_9HYPH|nr:hypothetical protein [Xanthobacter dioxanivorans]QRG06108.1 hypothetical protein EZH22_24470 [Xanthobacter dioxanivorans]